MKQPRMPFWTAWKLWRNQSKGMVVESITVGLLLSLACQSVVFTVVEFATARILKRVWVWWKGKDE